METWLFLLRQLRHFALTRKENFMFKKKDAKKTDAPSKSLASKNEKKDKAKKKRSTEITKKEKLKRIDISNAIPFTFDKEKNMFVSKDDEYIMMVRTIGTNLFGFKESDKLSFVNALSHVFNRSIGEGQIYSYQIGADVDGYVSDFQYFKDNLDLSKPEDLARYEILDQAQKRLKYTALTKELVDRCFVFVLKDKDLFRLELMSLPKKQTISWIFCTQLGSVWSILAGNNVLN